MDRIAISVNVYHICIVSTGYMQKCCNFFPLFLCVINHVNCHFFVFQQWKTPCNRTRNQSNDSVAAHRKASDTSVC